MLRIFASFSPRCFNALSRNRLYSTAPEKIDLVENSFRTGFTVDNDLQKLGSNKMDLLITDVVKHLEYIITFDTIEYNVECTKKFIKDVDITLEEIRRMRGIYNIKFTDEEKELLFILNKEASKIFTKIKLN